jgi:hypothetical protein
VTQVGQLIQAWGGAGAVLNTVLICQDEKLGQARQQQQQQLLMLLLLERIHNCQLLLLLLLKGLVTKELMQLPHAGLPQAELLQACEG